MDIDPQRLPAWLNAFAVRHGGYRVAPGEDSLQLTAADGTTVALWPPPGGGVHGDIDDFVAAALAHRRIGLLLARQASVAVGVADGPRLVTSKVDTFYVQSRTAAGGWSQQRYARRRSNQAKSAVEGAAELAVRLLLPEAATLASLVTGGDRRTVDAILVDPRLADLVPLRASRLLDVGEPRHAVLDEAAVLARRVRILIHDPPRT